MVFVDADKRRTPDYFQEVLPLMREGGVIVADNVVREGSLIDEDGDDATAAGLRRFLALAAAEPRVSATTIQTVGRKGYDGFTMALVEPL
jgi:predicted O-methyltransferase YrrM